MNVSSGDLSPPRPATAIRNSRGRILCVVGPTGSGKTAASLHLARMLTAMGLKPAVINADSRQTYRDFPVITAQPAREDREVCPHLLYGYLETTEKSSAGRWAERAGAILAEILSSGGIPLLVGGTGLYLRALLDGMADIPAPDPAVCERLEAACREQGPADLHRRLQAVDPAYAARIHPHDRQRVLRALEVWESTGRTFSEWHRLTPPPAGLKVLRLGIGLPLPELTPLLGARIRAMLEAGALDEARAAQIRCPDTSAPGWSGIGCAELAAHLAGDLDLDACVDLWTRHTRAYAKRQWTWFRADSRVVWLRPQEYGKMEKLARTFLEGGDPA